MGKKIKATVHNGRSGKNGVYNADHNTKKETRQQQDHIDDARTQHNIYVKFDEKSHPMQVKESFSAKDHEKEIYEKLYGEGLTARNERYAEEGHKDRAKTMDQIYSGKRTAPMESIYQLGNIHSDLDPNQSAKALWQAFGRATTIMQEKYGKNLRPLDAALHRDESVPHIHFRCTFAAEDQYGHLIPNQAKALDQMGIQRPNPDKKQSKFNCPIISFTDELRETFYQECEKQGFTIDREVTSESHRQKSLLELQCDRLSRERDTALEALRASQEAQATIQTGMIKAQAEMEHLRASVASHEEKEKKLKAKIVQLEEKCKDLDKKIEDRENEEFQAAKEKTGRSGTVYEVIEAKPGKKNFLGKVTQPAEPKKYIVDAEKYDKICKLANYNCNIIYRATRYKDLEKVQNNDPLIQELRKTIHELNGKLIGKDYEIDRIRRELQPYKDFVQVNRLEKMMEEQQKQERGYGRSR